MVTMSTATPANEHPGALACAQPFRGGIRVFYDRVQGYPPSIRARLLAYVLAHEITHVLEGRARHSESGIMKAHWDAGDMRQMGAKRLTFTAFDVLLIRQGLATGLSRDSRGGE
jgi:hypothetical protein